MNDVATLVLLTLAATLRVATPLVLCAMGGLFSEKAGIIDVGLEGKMLVAAFFAFVIGTAVSFLGNALWSFEARPTADRALMFFAINTTGLGLNMLIAWLMERAGIHYLLISLTVLIVVPMFNFAGHRVFTFGGRAK